MTDLIKINENAQGIKTVNARELHEFLEVGRDFSNWIKQRIENYSFQEGLDFTTELAKSNGGRPSIEYFISIDMAKELSMLQNSEKGKLARKYFIEMEKKAKQVFQVPKTFADALRLAADQQEKIEQQEKLLLEQKPKVDFANDVLGSSDVIDIGKVAKVLHKGVGRNKLFEILRDKKILQQNNIPYQTYIDRGYFRTIEQRYTKPDGSTHINIKTMVYQKGVAYIGKVIDTYKSKS